ncbi:MAG TPA: type IX secretion system plug protein domain-containing protein, partial [Mucilaginibacter sp.]|nr:type IX secretion system plug protein domain-containing protein [Mucilaginibacter sp.]
MLIITLIGFTKAFAQTPQYDNQVFSPGIKTVELYNTKKEQSFPLIELGSKEQLLLAFDDLNGGSRNFYYTIEHCDENWNSSNLPQSDYLPGFNEDQIRDYSYSSSTIQKYTHYQLRFP